MIEFIKSKSVEAGRLVMWRTGNYTYVFEIFKDGESIWVRAFPDIDFEAAEDEFARIN